MIHSWLNISLRTFIIKQNYNSAHPGRSECIDIEVGTGNIRGKSENRFSNKGLKSAVNAGSQKSLG